MADPVTLVPKPKASDEVRESVVSLLRKSLAEAESGEVHSALIILEDVNGEWISRQSTTLKFSETVGRLEIFKQEWIAQFLKKDGA